MIIDFNVHTGNWPEQYIHFGESDLIQLMDSSGVNLSVVSDIGIVSGSAENPQCGESTDDRLVHLRGVSPDADLEELAADDSICGLRIYPTYQAWDFTSGYWNELLSLLEQRNWMLHIYLRFRDPRIQAQVTDSDAVIKSLSSLAKEHKGLKLVFSGTNLYEADQNKGLFGRDNVWVDIAHLQHPMDSLSKLVDTLGDERILFGSNAPFFYPYTEVFRVRNSRVSDSTSSRIFSENAVRLLGL
ncbi:MAG TPA: amidohydrolase family protein [Armatimonadota bacterium]|jgi:predicted TIM-barrel fold metal-dependent hydrolase